MAAIDEPPKISDSPLEEKMESLELNEIENTDNPCSSTSRKRSLRRRLPTDFSYSEKRRVLTKPKKISNASTVDNIKQIYLGQKFNKHASPTLETIFEDPKVDKSNEISHTGQKKKRFLVFDQANKGKIRKRQVRMKKYYGRPTLKRERGLGMDVLLAKLDIIEL